MIRYVHPAPTDHDYAVDVDFDTRQGYYADIRDGGDETGLSGLPFDDWLSMLQSWGYVPMAPLVDEGQ